MDREPKTRQLCASTADFTGIGECKVTLSAYDAAAMQSVHLLFFLPADATHVFVTALVFGVSFSQSRKSVERGILNLEPRTDQVLGDSCSSPA